MHYIKSALSYSSSTFTRGLPAQTVLDTFGIMSSSTSTIETNYQYNVTENGAFSMDSTGDACVNLFFKLTRDVVENPLFLKWIDDAWAEDPLATLRLLFHGRDCRGGKGDRAPFIKAMAYIYERHPDWFHANYALIPEYGRYLDWFEIMLEIGQPLPEIIIEIANQLNLDHANMMEGKSVSLLAKWIPSEGKKWNQTIGFTDVLCCELFDIEKSNATYRRKLRKEYLTPLRAYIDVVERKMCGNEWDTIDFSRVPGVAMHRLKKTFKKHAPETFDQWVQEVEAGKAKINAKTVYPHTLVASMLKLINPYETRSVDDTQTKVANAQWNVLVEELLTKGTLGNSVVVCDVSGSMEGQPMEVAIGLGLLISSVASPPFQGGLITFSESPEFFKVPAHCKTLYEKVEVVSKMKWGANTNLQAVFDVILQQARMHKLSAEQMPERLYILSDMQFDIAMGSPNSTNFEVIRSKYASSGYAMPEIVFWNLRSDSPTDFPVCYDERGVILVSGFSQSILKQIMNSDDLSPIGLVRSVVNDPRYADIQSPFFNDQKS
jgi:hypothetical protein